MSKENEKQNIEIGKLNVRMRNVESKFDKFISNEFQHLRARVDWVLGTVIIGFLISIALIVLSKYL